MRRARSSSAQVCMFFYRDSEAGELFGDDSRPGGRTAFLVREPSIFVRPCYRRRPRRDGGTGRRGGLKNRSPQGGGGSTPPLGTKPLKCSRRVKFTRRGAWVCGRNLVKGWSVVIPPVASAGGFGAALAIGAAAGHVIRAEPLASLPAEAVVASLAPVLQRLLSSDG